MKAIRPCLVIIAIVGCVKPATQRPLPATSAPKPARAEPRLYTDVEIRKMAKQNGVDPIPTIGDDIFKVPTLNVVPNGHVSAREKVFSALGLDDGRLSDPGVFQVMNVAFLTWQVSPSYYLSCMVALNAADNDSVHLANPKNGAYGIRVYGVPR